MEIFISGEIESEVANVYRISTLAIRRAFNAQFTDRSFGSGLVEMTYVAIIIRLNSPSYCEVKKYSKKQRSAEFRLKIPLDTCLLADIAEMTQLAAASLHRAIVYLKEMKIPDFDYEAFEAEYLALARREDWLI